MNKIKIISIFLYCWIPLIAFSQTGVIKGHIIEGGYNRGFAFVNLTLLNTGLTATTDLDGNFQFTQLKAGSYELKLSNAGLKDSVIKSLVIQEGEILQLEFIYPYCNYDINQSTCPFCDKQDQVIRIVYGYPSKGALRSAKKGKLRLGGCEITGCDPHHYCKRDQKEF